MNRIYLDNACTSFPKPPCVCDNVYNCLLKMTGSVNRGSYSKAYESEEVVYETRKLLCSFFGGENPRNVVFTSNVTESLNIILRGFLESGDKVLISGFEHNAVMRTLTDINADIIAIPNAISEESTYASEVSKEWITLFEQHSLKAVVMTAADNVFGQIMPINEIGKLCHRFGVKFILDTAQGAGSIPINMTDMNIDALAFTGHKGLLGPSGIGGFILTDEMVPLIKPLITGGTGSVSHLLTMPEFMPDKFEAGTLNLPGIVGLKAGIEWINETGLDAIREKEINLMRRFIRGLLPLVESNSIEIPGYNITSDIIKDCEVAKAAPEFYDTHVSIVSIKAKDFDQAEVAAKLDSEYGIMTRVGLHCNPKAHERMGTYPEGTIRFSFGYFNTEDEIDMTITALTTVIANAHRRTHR